MNKPQFEELKTRIQEDIKYYHGEIPEKKIIAWDGYLAALIEWDLVSVEEHGELCRMLPEINENPATEILLGHNNY